MPAAAAACLERPFVDVPDLVRAHPLGRPVGELDAHVVEAEIAVNAQDQLGHPHRFLGDLLRGAEDVGIVLGEGAHPHQAVQRPRGLIAVHLAEFGEAQRQLAVAAQPLLEHLDVPGTVHRLDGEGALIRRLGHEHVLAEIGDVTGLHPELPVHDFRRVDFQIARRILPLAHVGDQLLEQSPALRMPKHRARRLLLQVEQVELLADAPVVALLGLLQARQVLLELLLVGPGRAVDPLQHLVARVAAPVGARDFHQLERLELAGARHMRAAAQILPIALPVQADRLVDGDRGDDLGLVMLAELLKCSTASSRGSTRRCTFRSRPRSPPCASRWRRDRRSRTASCRRSRNRSRPRSPGRW